MRCARSWRGSPLSTRSWPIPKPDRRRAPGRRRAAGTARTLLIGAVLLVTVHEIRVRGGWGQGWRELVAPVVVAAPAAVAGVWAGRVAALAWVIATQAAALLAGRGLARWLSGRGGAPLVALP